MSQSTPTPVDLSAHLPSLVVWASFTFLAALGNLLLLLLSLLVPRLRANPLLLHLHFVFVVSGLVGGSLILEGDAMNQTPTSGRCLFNAAAILSNSALEAGAALGLVAKVWSNALSVQHPQSRILRTISNSPLLIALPYIVSFPLFFASIGIGLNAPSTVYRGSPFYCTIQSPSITVVSPVVTAVITLVALVLAGWTTALVARYRWRAVRTVRSLQIKNYRLVVRVLAFSVVVAVAFVCGLVSIAIGFSVDWNDIVVASLGVGAFFIFVSDKDILSLLFRCRREPASSSQFTSVSTGIRFHGGVVGVSPAPDQSGVKAAHDGFPPHPAVSFSGQMYAREEVMLSTFNKSGLDDDVEEEDRAEEKQKGTHGGQV